VAPRNPQRAATPLTITVDFVHGKTVRSYRLSRILRKQAVAAARL
jgi:hypothetical protein